MNRSHEDPAFETAAELERYGDRLGEPHPTPLRPPDQHQKIAALEEQIELMTEHQAELRTMLHAAHRRLLEAQELLEAGGGEGITSLHAELVAARQRAAELEGQLAVQREAAEQWAARAADLEQRLARVRNSPAGRAYRLLQRWLRPGRDGEGAGH